MSHDMKAHPAQPDNLATQQAVNMLRASAAVLLLNAQRLCRQRLGPTKRSRIKRQLSGVLADVETVRVAIKE